MSFTIIDPELLAQLRRAEESIELLDPDGKLLGTFAAGDLGKLPAGVVSPFTEEELNRRRQNRSGRPLSEILADLRARA